MYIYYYLQTRIYASFKMRMYFAVCYYIFFPTLSVLIVLLLLIIKSCSTSNGTGLCRSSSTCIAYTDLFVCKVSLWWRLKCICTSVLGFLPTFICAAQTIYTLAEYFAWVVLNSSCHLFVSMDFDCMPSNLFFNFLLHVNS